MIFTSYFAKIKKFPENVIPVAITAVVPNWYDGLSFSLLAPKYDILMKFKDDHNEADYTECFNNTTLKYLNPLWVLHSIELDILGADCEKFPEVPFWENPDYHVALVCYEKPSDFCHRHLIAKWLENYGVECKEWEESV